MKQACRTTFCGCPLSVLRVSDKEDLYGEFLFDQMSGEAALKVNSKLNDKMVFETLLHELLEGYLALSGYSWESKSANSYRTFFMFEHDGLTAQSREVSNTLLDIVKKLKIEVLDGE